MRGCQAVLLVALLFLGHSAEAAMGVGLRPRAAAIKVEAPAWDARLHSPDRLWVKFLDDLQLGLRDGRLHDNGSGALAGAEAALQQLKGTWQRDSELPLERLDRLRRVAETNLGRAMADLSSQFYYHLAAGEDAQAMLNLLNGLETVEIALPAPRPAPPPLPPSFQSQQVYLNAAPAGVNALATWSSFNVRGQGIRIADVEYSWNDNHIDLPDVTLIGPAPDDPFGDTHHGTAVIGALASMNNGWGTTGIAYEASLHFSAANTKTGFNVAAAILRTLDVLGPGDIILIEQQTGGPTFEYVPVEWFLPNYNAIVTAVGNLVTVVEAAGNGNQNLDNPIYSQGNGGHWPFLAENDSGAIIVGAGAAPAPFGSTVDRSRLFFSTYGSTVDLQGWGESVVTLGYGFLWSSGGINQYYTNGFGGTSSASPIVAGACALLQSAYKTTTGGDVLTPLEVRAALRETGSAQQSGAFPASQNIGPRPDALAAIESLLDCNHNGVFDTTEIAEGVGEDCNGNLRLDECESGPIEEESGPLSPLGGLMQVYTVRRAEPAAGDVMLSFQAVGDLGFSSESVQVSLNDLPLATIFQAEGSDCPARPDQAQVIVQSSIWNAAVEAGLVEIQMTPSAGVDPGLCGLASFISVAVSYASAEASDCNLNGVLDACEIAAIDHGSDTLSPLGAGVTQTFTLTSVLPATGEVTLAFTAYGDLGFSSENVAVDVNGTPVGVLWAAVGEGHDCPAVPDTAQIVVPETTWNALSSAGVAAIHMVPSAGVLATQCPLASYIMVTVSYAADAPLDADADGVVDSCRGPSNPADLNGDGTVNGLDLALLLGAWGACPVGSACLGDLDGSGVVDGFDLATLLAAWG